MIETEQERVEFELKSKKVEPKEGEMCRLKNESAKNAGVPSLIESISKWHHERNLVDGTTDAHQFVKLTEEVGELAGNIARGKDISDDVGDIIVVLINHCERNNLSIYDCLLTAWMDIKDRKGKMVDGMFIKESDLCSN